MREKDIHNMIEKQKPDEKQQMWDYIQSQIDEPALRPKQEVAVKPKKWKWAAVALAIVCVVTLSVVLPITLRNGGGGGNNGGGGGDGIRYCTMKQCEIAQLGQTLSEYSASHNKGFLYVDWYDGADEITTTYGHNKEDINDVFYFSERIVNGETGEAITVSVTDNKTRVDVFVNLFSEYGQFMMDGMPVKFRLDAMDKTIATFEYQNNIYYLEYEEADSMTRLIEIIQDMLK